MFDWTLMGKARLLRKQKERTRKTLLRPLSF